MTIPDILLYVKKNFRLDKSSKVWYYVYTMLLTPTSPAHIGTENNVERTGDRDAAFSDLMRLPRDVRVIDMDPSPVCKICKQYIMILEVKRKSERPTPGWIWAHTEVMRNLGERAQIEVYFIWHEPGKRLTVFKLSEYQGKDFRHEEKTPEQFVKWIEHKKDTHVCILKA